MLEGPQGMNCIQTRFDWEVRIGICYSGRLYNHANQLAPQKRRHMDELVLRGCIPKNFHFKCVFVWVQLILMAYDTSYLYFSSTAGDVSGLRRTTSSRSMNCSFSVEPSIASVGKSLPEAICVISSKYSVPTNAWCSVAS